MATNSMDFTSGLTRPSGSKAMAENYLGSTARPYALRVINDAMGSKFMDPDNLCEDATGSYSKRADGKNYPSGSHIHNETTATQNIESVLSQKNAPSR